MPHDTFDDLVTSCVAGADLDVDAHTDVVRAARQAGRAGEQLVGGLMVVGVLERVAFDHDRGVVRLPVADIERFAPDLASASRPAPGAVSRLVRFEVERVHGMLDAAYTVVGPLPLDQRLRVSWEVGHARARLHALSRQPDPFAPHRARPWRVSRLLAAFRTLRRAHHRRSAPVVGR
jgi:phytoene/squalene synthetase